MRYIQYLIKYAQKMGTISFQIQPRFHCLRPQNVLTEEF